MGVDLGSILERSELSLDSLSGKRIAIDAFNSIYQFLTIIRQPDGAPLADRRGRITSHLSGLFYRTCNLVERGIRPTYVFDGTPSELKRATLEARAQVKREAVERMKTAREEGRMEEAAMLAQRTVRLTPDIAEESKKLLSLMGIPWIQAPSEGEAQCAVMCREGLVHAVGSQDYDALLFGTPLLARNLTIAGKRKVPRREMYVDVVPELIDLQANLERLGLSREQLIHVGLLIGTDFNKGIHGIGPKKGLKLVASFPAFGEALASLGDRAAGFDWKPVQELFEHPPAITVEKSRLDPLPPQRDALISFMADEHDFSGERLNATLARAFKEPLDSSQSSLGGWV